MKPSSLTQGNLTVTKGESSRPNAGADRAILDNTFYDELGKRWHEGADHPIALLRAEGALKNPWVAERIREVLGSGPAFVLDIGCGGGLLARHLAAEGHRVTGLDASVGSLRAARTSDKQLISAPAYFAGDAYNLPFATASFDAVCALDFLEHVTEPGRVIAEAARVLKPGGLFLFHTFNRNLLAWLVIIKGVEWFVRNVPRHMHVLPLFIKPRELSDYCMVAGLRVETMRGMRPVVDNAFWQLLVTRKVPSEFRFRFTPSLALGYLGTAVRLPIAG
jgi:2-polyprenyl-6-hydroxyphenyl methylase / 3-demethylubiquinone-9 3-methyltransferase